MVFGESLYCTGKLLHRQNASSHLSTWGFVSLGEVCVMYSEVSAAGRLLSGWLMWGKCFRAVSRWESLV